MTLHALSKACALAQACRESSQYSLFACDRDANEWLTMIHCSDHADRSSYNWYHVKRQKCLDCSDRLVVSSGITFAESVTVAAQTHVRVSPPSASVSEHIFKH
jgi:hypothetical protein